MSENSSLRRTLHLEKKWLCTVLSALARYAPQATNTSDNAQISRKIPATTTRKTRKEAQYFTQRFLHDYRKQRIFVKFFLVARWLLLFSQNPRD
jgi:hypothetical protein